MFGRDLLEVEIWDNNRKHKLFTVYNNHLKSHYVPWWENKRTGKMKNNKRREKQAEVIAHIVKARMRPNSRFIILGDMNDPPDSQWLAPFINDEDLSLTNALTNPKETRPSKADKFPPSSKAWTHRFKPSKKPTEYKLYDQIWISPSLKDKQIAQKIDRRTKHKGDGSDHDPAWIELDL